MQLESEYEKHVVKRLKYLFPGCIIRKQTPYPQGWPDRVIYWGPHWAMLEIKRSPKASLRPNQLHYVNKLNEMSFAALIHPGNEEEVLDALQRAFRSRR